MSLATRADTSRMIALHDLDFIALLASGVIGALIATPVRAMVTVVANRSRSSRRG